MNRFLPARRVAAASAALTLVVAGCSSGSSESSDTSSSSSTSPSSVDPAPANPGSSTEPTSPTSTPQSDEEKEEESEEMAAGDVDKKQLAAVKSYLDVRENAESERYKDRKAWEAALTKVTTGTGKKTAVKSYGPEDRSNARMVAVRFGYEVKVSVSDCVETPGFGSGEGSLAVQCQLTDLVTDKSGDVVGSSEVDITWPYYGAQDAPMLVLTKKGGKWLVDGDYTGRAS